MRSVWQRFTRDRLQPGELVALSCALLLGAAKPAQPRVAVLPNTLPPEFDDDLQNHFLAGILAPMRDVVLLFFLHKTKTPKTVSGRAASPARLSRFRWFAQSQNMKPASITPRAWLVLLAADSESNIRASDEVSKVNDRDVTAKEEGVLDPSRGHGEGERAGSGAVPQQVRFVRCQASARLDVFRPDGKRKSVFEIVVGQDRAAVGVRAGGADTTASFDFTTVYW